MAPAKLDAGSAQSLTGPLCGALIWAVCLAGPCGVPPALAGTLVLMTLLVLLATRRRAKRGLPTRVVTPAQLFALATDARRRPGPPGQSFLGRGGRWQAWHSAALHAASVPDQGLWQAPGRQPKAPPVWLPDALLRRNVLALGAPGSGKSSLMILLAWQAQLRGQPVIVIDPKGSLQLQRQLAAGARQARRPFLCLQAGCPPDSVRYDPLRQCRNGAEIATRLCSLIPGEAADPFRTFCWGVLATLADGLLSSGQPATLAALRAALEDAGATLLDALPADCPHVERVRPGVAALVAHDRVHFRKMTAALIPVFELLSAGGLEDGRIDQAHRPAPVRNAHDTNSRRCAHDSTPGGGASGPATPRTEQRPLLDLAACRDQGATLYVGLDALGNPTLAQALGRLLLEDLAMQAARRMQSGGPAPELQLIVDEAGEVACEALLQLLGKGREAGVQLLLAVQTLSDLEWHLGGAAAARVAEGNAAAWFLFRQLDAGSRRESEARLGPLPLARESRSEGHSRARSFGRRQEGESIAFGATREFLARVPETCFPALQDLECLAQLADGSLWHLRLPLPAAD